MSETRHTKGPWTIETVPTSCGICHKIGPFPTKKASQVSSHACLYVDYPGNGPVEAEVLANARLIAAAPELLEALTSLLFASENADETGYVTDVGFIDLEEIQQTARAVIARATA